MPITPIAIISVDRSFRPVHFNEVAIRLIGTAAPLPFLDETTFAQTIVPAVDASGAWEGDVTRQTIDGVSQVLQLTITPWIDGAGDMVGYMILAKDVTADKQSEQTEKKRQARAKAIFETAADAMFTLNAQAKVMDCNVAATTMLDRPRDGICGQFFDDLLEKSAGSAFQMHFERMQRGNLLDVEVQAPRRGGALLDLWLRGAPILSSDEMFVGANLVARDITEIKEETRDLEREAVYDSLTGLPKRDHFRDRLSRAFLHAKSRPDRLLAVLFLDIDHLKRINDSLGHRAGDQFLEQVAKRIVKTVPPVAADAVCRLGGDEFAVVLENLTDVSDATRVAANLVAELAKPFSIKRNEVLANCSVGISLTSIPYERAEDLVRDAETALVRAKESSNSSRYAVFDRDMHEAALRRIRIESELHRVLERDELRLFYQPIISPHSREIVSFEALVRWFHPTDGMVRPDLFIPIAEETGLINEMGRWILREACRQAGEWKQRFPERKPISIHVNISSRQLNQPDMVEQVEHELNAADVTPDLIKLEITESLLMDKPKAAMEALERLETLGVEIHIDDFGTGYSSLSYLHSFPFGALKVDRSFVNRMRADPVCMEIVRTILGLSRNIGFEVIAEGVETAEQVSVLTLLGCDYLQGFYYSKPVPADQATELLLRPLGPTN